jgi:hypothetical protein
MTKKHTGLIGAFILFKSKKFPYAFGNARFYGSMGGKPMNASVVGMAATKNGQGY